MAKGSSGNTIIPLAVISIVMAGWIFFSRNREEERRNLESMERLKVKLRATVKKRQQERRVLQKEKPQAVETVAKKEVEAQNVPVDPFGERHPDRLKAQKELSDFKKALHLDIDLPHGIKTLPLDLDFEEAEGIYWSIPQKNAKFALIGARGSFSTDEIVGFLNGGEIPFIKKSNAFNKNAIKSVSPEGKPGVASLKILTGTPNKDGTHFYAAIIERSDGKGSYLFAGKGDEKFFDENEGTFERMYQSLKIMP